MPEQAKQQSATPRFTNLLDRVAAQLPKGRGGFPDLKPLEQYIGKNHAQVYEWVITRKVLANGEVTLSMLEWVENEERKKNCAESKNE